VHLSLSLSLSLSLFLSLSLRDPPRDTKSISRFAVIPNVSYSHWTQICIRACWRAVSTAARNYRTAIQCVPRKRTIVSTGFFRHSFIHAAIMAFVIKEFLDRLSSSMVHFFYLLNNIHTSRSILNSRRSDMDFY